MLEFSELLLRYPTLDRRKPEFPAFYRGDGLVTPPGLWIAIGTLYPIAL